MLAALPAVLWALLLAEELSPLSLLLASTFVLVVAAVGAGVVAAVRRSRLDAVPALLPLVAAAWMVVLALAALLLLLTGEAEDRAWSVLALVWLAVLSLPLLASTVWLARRVLWSRACPSLPSPQHGSTR